MSMSSPSIVFYQGLRCTKVPRLPRATTTAPTTSSEFNSSPPSTTSHGSSSDSASLEETPQTDHSTSITEVVPSVATAPTTNTSTSSTDTTSSTSKTSHISSSELSTRIHNAASAETSGSYTTITPSTSVIAPTVTSQPLPPPAVPKDHEDGTSLGAIFGSVLGGLGFIALVLLIFYLCFRHRCRRRPFRGWIFGRREKLLRDNRASADSTTNLNMEYQSGMPYLSEGSPVHSANNSIRGSEQYLSHDQMSSPYPNPFSDSAEVTHGAESSIVPITVGRSSLDANQQPQMLQPSKAVLLFPLQHEEATQPEYSRPPDRDSFHSDTSLGSTLILPGRSSVGSSIRRNSFPLQMKPSNGLSFPEEAATRDSTRSNPFDLDVPQFPVSGRNPETTPIVLL